LLKTEIGPGGFSPW